MKLKSSKIWQFLLGSFLGIAILAALTGGGLFLLVQRLTAPPNRPTFDNEAMGQKATPGPDRDKPSPNIASPSPTLSPSASSSPLPAGAYEATVSYSEGLSVRDSPDGGRVGGIDYNEKVIVLEESADKRWVKIRAEQSNVEGWVKAGNLERAN